MKTQQNEAKLRLEKLQSELDSGINSALKSSKNKKKEKLLKSLGKSSARKTDESQGDSSVVEAATPIQKKDKKSKKKKGDKPPASEAKPSRSVEMEESPANPREHETDNEMPSPSKEQLPAQAPTRM